MKTFLITKSIGWSYPTSPNAKDLGFNKTGCYSVAVTPGSPKALAGFKTLAEAKSYADTLPYGYDKFSL